MSYYEPVGPAYWMSKKEIVERTMTIKREREARIQRENEANCRYFNDLQTEAVKHDSWTSENMSRISREAHRAKMEKENKERLLNERKTKLALMLKEEKEQFEIEFKKMSERRYARSENKENSRDQENKPLRDCYREWIRNKQTNKMLTNNNEISDKKDKVDNSKFEKLKLLDEENDEYKLKQTEEVIKRHMEELKMKEKETNRLRLELELLQKKQWKLEELEEEQQERIKEHNKTKETARILKHQLKVHLQNRARDILTQLEEDREMMRHAAHEMEFERKQNDVWREKNRNDTEKFRKIIDEQIEAEKKRQSELGSLFNEEAGKVWKQLEEQWNRERYFRREVMSELMDGLRKETEEKIVENVKQQEESVKTREDLLRMIEEGKEKMLKNQKKLSEQMQIQNGGNEDEN